MAKVDGGGMGGALREAGRASLWLLAALLPFEMTRPLARLGPLQLSSVELFLYLALAMWGVSVVVGWLEGARVCERGASGRRLPATHVAALVWTLVLFASALCAPALRGTAFKFALRSLSGILLYAAAVDLLRGPAAITRVAQALAVGAISAALLMLAEGRLARVTAALRPFHRQSFDVFGLVRGSGPFQYPNIAAMYLEAVLPLVFVLGPSSIVARSPRPHAGASQGPIAGTAWRLLALLALLGGILTTASRAGLATAVVCLVALAICLGRAPVTRRSAWAALGALAVLGLASQLASSALTLRLRFWKDADWYRASLVPVAGPAGEMPARLPPGGEISVTIEARNLGALTWRRLPPTPVALSYHWVDADSGEITVFDGARSELPSDVAPGGSAIVRGTAVAPTRPGRYLLWWDLVHEHATWFSQRGNPGVRGAIEVAGLDAIGAPGVTTGGAGGGGRFATNDVIPRAALWRAALAAWREHPLLGLGADNFRHLYGRYLGLSDPDDRLHANNFYLETLADEGTLGLLALVFLVGALGSAARRAAAPPATRLLALGLSVGLGAYLIHGVFDTFLEFTPTFALPWLLAGMLVALGRPPGEVAA